MGSFRYLFYTKDIFCKHEYNRKPNQALVGPDEKGLQRSGDSA
jgi:hypothetical protein